jgi:hypothetical protein
VTNENWVKPLSLYVCDRVTGLNRRIGRRGRSNSVPTSINRPASPLILFPGNSCYKAAHRLINLMRASFRQIGAEFVARNKVAYRVNTTIPGHTLAFGNGNKFVGNGV